MRWVNTRLTNKSFQRIFPHEERSLTSLTQIVHQSTRSSGNSFIELTNNGDWGLKVLALKILWDWGLSLPASTRKVHLQIFLQQVWWQLFSGTSTTPDSNRSIWSKLDGSRNYYFENLQIFQITQKQYTICSF